MRGNRHAGQTAEGSNLRVLVVGEALTDIIRSSGRTEELPGGSPANVALGLARLGLTTSFLTALAPDLRGREIAARLMAAGGNVLAESWSLSETSTAAAEIQSDGSAKYAFEIVWQLPERIRIPSVDHVHIGSIAAFLTPGADRAERLLRSLPPSVTVSFDPNIRPALVGDPSAAKERFERLASLASLVKLSDEDAEFLYPGSTPRQAAKAIAALGPLVAVTQGAKGSLLLAEDSLVEIRSFPAAVVDTVGAGDSYMSALLQALLRGGYPKLRPSNEVQLQAAGEFAALAAAITVTRPGAEPPTISEVTQRLRRPIMR